MLLPNSLLHYKLAHFGGQLQSSENFSRHPLSRDKTLFHTCFLILIVPTFKNGYMTRWKSSSCACLSCWRRDRRAAFCVLGHSILLRCLWFWKIENKKGCIEFAVNKAREMCPREPLRARDERARGYEMSASAASCALFASLSEEKHTEYLNVSHASTAFSC